MRGRETGSPWITCSCPPGCFDRTGFTYRRVQLHRLRLAFLLDDRGLPRSWSQRGGRSGFSDHLPVLLVARHQRMSARSIPVVLNLPCPDAIRDGWKHSPRNPSIWRSWRNGPFSPAASDARRRSWSSSPGARASAQPLKMNLSLILLDEETADFGAVFTRNLLPGAPVLIGTPQACAPTDPRHAGEQQDFQRLHAQRGCRRRAPAGRPRGACRRHGGQSSCAPRRASSAGSFPSREMEAPSRRS